MPDLRRTIRFDGKSDARPQRGPGMQRARPARHRQRFDLREWWWARQGLNLWPLPCQQTAGNRCAQARFRRSRPTVDPEVKCSPGVQLGALS